MLDVDGVYAMDCMSCGQTNPTGSRFCSGCGSSLAPRCPACGTESPSGARFCNGCGAALTAQQPAAPAVSRKIVTIVFADLIGSVALHERLDAESARRVMDRYHRAMSAAVDVHGGRVVQLLGDGVLAAFGVPRVAEDDAIRAVRAAVGMQRAFRELAREQAAAMQGVGLRVAVNTGEIVVSDDENSVMGDPTNVAARLQQEARDGDVIVGEGTQRLVGALVTLAPLGSFALRGRAESVAAYRVVSLDRPASAQAIAFVGREDELQRLVAVYDAAVTAPAARLAVLLGSPGLGKSRLVAEFTRRAAERATILSARCDAARGATFAPLAEALRGLLRIDEGAGGDVLRAAIDAVVRGDDAERTRIATGIGSLLAGTPAPPEETFFVVRRLLAALAAVRPVVLVIDDLHWAEPLLLDLVEHLVQWGSGMPLLVVVAARPELRDARSSLTVPGPLVAEVTTLSGLDAGAATRLAANVIGGTELPAGLAGRVLATSEGNPLFVSELVRMLVQDGTLARDGERWITTVEVAKLDMPPTIQVLLAARIERLRPEERSVLERAAVIGRQFSRAAVAHLLPRDAHDLDARLEALRRGELIEPDTGWFLGEPALRFHHVLIRDAAYRRVLKETRAELHERLADWIAGRAGDAVEHDETIGFHLEHAHQNRLELGPLDAHGLALGERAARHLGAAGRRALARDDLPPAAGLLGRALDRLGADDPARADLVLDWCEALLAAGDVGTAARAITELGRLMNDSDRLRAWHTCFSGQLAVLTDPKALRASEGAVAAAAETLTAAGDGVGEAKAHATHALVLAQLGKIGACEAALDKALAAARRAGERRLANAVLAGAPVAALWGPSPVTRASGRCLDVVRVLRITLGAPAVEAVALRCQAVLETLRGRGDAARRMIASSRHLVEELGITQRVLEADLFAGLIELLEGDPTAAERWLREAWDGLRGQGLGIEAAHAGALLARALLAQGRVDEAEVLSHESESLSGDSFRAAIAWRRVRAEVLAARGEHAAAVDVAGKAVEIAAATDDLLDHADARASLAVALRAAGRDGEADAEERRAVELWEAKGATLLVERARRAVGRVAEPLRRAPEAPEPARSTRRVRANSAVALGERFRAAALARDMDAIAAFCADDIQVHHHPTGALIDREAGLNRFRMLCQAEGLAFSWETLATLGDSLELAHDVTSFDHLDQDDLSFGASSSSYLNLMETNARGQCTRVDVFADDHLGDAVARLYERYAELLPDGPERERAAATARSVSAMPLAGPIDIDRWASVFAPDIEAVDPRTVGFGSLHGAETFLHTARAFRELVEDPEGHVEDVLDLRSEALLVRWTNSGTPRGGGGSFERTLLMLWAFGADGLLTRWEQYDVHHVSAALARFDELAAARPAPRPVRRRVLANAASAHRDRVAAAFAARDMAALEDLLAPDFEAVNHAHGAVYGREGPLAAWRGLLALEGGRLWWEPLATLGDSLVLVRQRSETRGGVVGSLDVGPAVHETLHVNETDARGRARRGEVFAADRLVDAVVRLYERYAELLPEGLARARATATARSVAAAFSLTPSSIDRYAAVLAPGIELVDHRALVRVPPAHGAIEWLQRLEGWFETVEDSVTSIDDVLDLRSAGLLVRGTERGHERAGGGSFEVQLLQTFFFDDAGLVARMELFDADREAEALARFDELTATLPRSRAARRVRPNSATARMDALAAAAAARDLDATAAVFAEGMRFVHHLTGAVLEREELVAWWRLAFGDRDHTLWVEPLAALGESLALHRQWVSASAVGGTRLDLGGYEQELHTLTETGPDGRFVAAEMYDADHLGDALARLYERYAELLPDGPERESAAATARSVATLLGPLDLDCYRTALAPDLVFIDSRSVGVGPLQGAEALLAALGSLLALTADIANRVDDVLGIRTNALLARWTNLGTDRAGGGAYERPFLMLWVWSRDGLAVRGEQFDVGREAEALARFDALTAQPKPSARRPVRANAATALATSSQAAMSSGDLDALSAFWADDVQFVRGPAGTALGRKEMLAWLRLHFADPGAVMQQENLAVLGDALALQRCTWAGGEAGDSDYPVGAFERNYFQVFEVDAQGRFRWSESFAPDRLGDAVVRLYERHAALLPEGPERERAAAIARAIALIVSLTSSSIDRFQAILAPSVELEDYRALVRVPPIRGVVEWRQRTEGWFEAIEDSVFSIEDVLDLRPGGLVARLAERGHDRTGGGRFEIQLLNSYLFDADGRLARVELSDPDQERDALARFDALVAPRPAPRRMGRVRPNAATVFAARSDAAFAARGVAALERLIRDDYEMLDHPSSVTYDRAAELASHRALLSAREPVLRHEPLATLGASLALCRQECRASGVASGDLDVGAIERDRISLIEADAQGCVRRIEIFALDRLGDAVARLYERHAELLPDGPEHARAAAITRSLAAIPLGGPFDVDRYAAVFAPDIEAFDPRTVGFGTLRGADQVLRPLRAFQELTEDPAGHVGEVLGLRSDALLVRWTSSGRLRSGGGRFERPLLALWAFGADGLLTRWEQHDPDREAEALARFDELAATQPLRRVRPNSVTENAAHVVAAVRAQDLDAVSDLFSERFEALDHKTGATYGCEGALATARMTIDDRDLAFRQDPIATLGDRLALLHNVVSSSGTVRGDLDVGPFEAESIYVAEVDERGRRLRNEWFAPDHLGDAIARLYERYAELVPEGSARERAATIAGTVAVWSGPLNLDDDRAAASLASTFECVDHRTLGTWSARGPRQVLRHWRAQLDLATNAVLRDDALLALGPSAFLTRRTYFGTERAGGGAYENPLLALMTFDAGGLLERVELFDPDREAEALARFDALVAEPQPLRRRVRPNAATANVGRLDGAIETRDLDAVRSLLADDVAVVHHPTGASYDREGTLVSLHMLMGSRDLRSEHIPLATLGERLALFRHPVSFSGLGDDELGPFGAVERESLILVEVDEANRQRRVEFFAPHHLLDAIARLCERYAELLPEGFERTRAVGTARWAEESSRESPDLDRIAATLAADAEFLDHRSLVGFESSRGREAMMRNLRSLVELSERVEMRADDLLGFRSDALLVRWTNLGTLRDGGGAYERRFLLLLAFGPAGVLTRIEWFDPDRDAEALARFDALTAELASPRIENAATRLTDRIATLAAARDHAGVTAMLAPGFRMIDHGSTGHLEVDSRGFLDSSRFLLAMRDYRSTSETLATRGDRLALKRTLVEVADRDVGPSEIEALAIVESDPRGERLAALVFFDPHDLDAAYAELDARYVALGTSAT